jgi:hypothetical protein
VGVLAGRLLEVTIPDDFSLHENYQKEGKNGQCRLLKLDQTKRRT